MVKIIHKYIYPVEETLKVTDGDTMTFILDLGFRLSRKTVVRLYGVDTHEIHGDKNKLAQKEKEFVENWLNCQDYLMVETINDDGEVKKGSFGRWLGRIYGTSGIEKEELNKVLLDKFDNIRYE